ncbi:MAG: hypothetical protein IKU29_05210 [Parabacteroides sp.]|nr:hypothetical protein [Parabacteroides sp.]
MKKFISQDLTIELQHKGYPLSRVYRQDDRPILYELPDDYLNYAYCKAWFIPTIDEVIDWLEIEKGICIELVPFPTFVSRNKIAWCSTIKYDSDGVEMKSIEFDKYRMKREDLLIDVITYIIENLI